MSKYYTPKMEDLKVGYVTERIIQDFSRHFDIFLPEGATQEEYDKGWEQVYHSDRFESEPWIIREEDISFVSKIGERFIKGIFRTPLNT